MSAPLRGDRRHPCRHSPLAVAGLKRAINETPPWLPAAASLVAGPHSVRPQSADAPEGVRAWTEKRTPVFSSGR